MQIDFSNIQSIVVTSVVLGLVVFGTYLYNTYFKQWLKAKGYEAAFNRIVLIVRTIDQQASKFGWTNERKKEIAILMATQVCQALKIKMTDEEINDLIEAAVNLVRKTINTQEIQLTVTQEPEEK